MASRTKPEYNRRYRAAHIGHIRDYKREWARRWRAAHPTVRKRRVGRDIANQRRLAKEWAKRKYKENPEPYRKVARERARSKQLWYLEMAKKPWDELEAMQLTEVQWIQIGNLKKSLMMNLIGQFRGLGNARPNRLKLRREALEQLARTYNFTLL